MCVMFISLVVLFWVCTVECASVKSQSDDKPIIYPDDLDISKFARQNYMQLPHFQHSPEFHRNHPEIHHHHHHHHPFDEPDLKEEVEEPMPKFGDSDIEIPLEFIQDINDYNVSDLLVHFVEGAEGRDILIEDRFGDDGIQEKNAATSLMAKDAKCMPELQTVKIAGSDDPSVLYIPQCTRIERCGGCCKHNLLSCQPVEKESVSLKIVKTKYTDKKLKFLGNELVTVEKHNKCKCDCRIKKENCTEFQEYRESECRCVCRNYDDREKCAKNNKTKLWNSDLCTCQCRDNIQCSTGSYYDSKDCKCVSIPMKRRFADYQEKIYDYEPAAVVPLDEY